MELRRSGGASPGPAAMATPSALVEVYVGALRADAGAGSATATLDPDQLESELVAICDAAVASTPEVAESLPDFVRHLARQSRGGSPPSREHAADLGLAFACARRVASALRRLDSALTTNVARAVARIDGSTAFADAVAQELRERLILGEPPKIGEYAGRGSLAGWLRTAAVRTALNLRRGQAERAHDPVASGLPETGEGPETEVLRAKYRADFEAAVRVALRRLSSRERAILCLNVRDGLGCDGIAALYRVGRSTVKRWLASAREELAREVKRELRERLHLSSSEYDSLAAGLRSAVDVSIARLLAEPEAVS
jgi:RNA polymerase sigma-70 factor (ECF subfamily)